MPNHPGSCVHASEFDPLELAARVRAVLRRATTEQAATESVVKADQGRLEIDLERRIVRRGGELVSLSRTEWLLLQYLASNPDRVMLNNQVLSNVWGPEYRDEFQYLRVWVFRLRQKLEENPSEPRIVKTLPGIGLMLVSDEQSSSSDRAATTSATGRSGKPAARGCRPGRTSGWRRSWTS